MYRLTQQGAVIRLADCMSIPLDLDNQDYVAYLAWVNAGGVPLPAPQPTVEQRIAAVLNEAGETRLTIQMAIELAETKALAMGAALGLTPEQALALAYEKNKAYRVCKDTEATIRALEQADAG